MYTRTLSSSLATDSNGKQNETINVSIIQASEID